MQTFTIKKSLITALFAMAVAVPATFVTQAQSALPDVPRDQTLIIDPGLSHLADTSNWNPFAPGAGVIYQAGYNQVADEPLFILNYESSKVEPWLADSMTHNATQDVWTLKLKSGITWSDGTPYNADDVVYTAQLYVDNAATFGAGWVKSVKSTTKVDDLTVTFTLLNPDPYFQLNTFVMKSVATPFNVIPKHIFQGQDALTYPNFDLAKGLPLGTGPYKLVKVTSTDVTWDLNPNYWGAKTGFTNLPAPKRVIFTTTGTEETAGALLSQDKVDSTSTLSAQTFAALAPKNANLTGWYPKAPYAWFDPCERNLEFNLTVAPFNDPDIRHALSDVINRDQVVAVAYGGNSIPSIAPFPNYGGLAAYVKKAQDAGLYKTNPIGYDPTTADKILTSKGYTKGSDGFYQKDGQDFAFNIVTPDYPEIVAVGQVLAEQFQQFGINATQSKQDPGVAATALFKGTNPVAVGWNMCASVTEPFSSLNTLNNKFLVPTGQTATSDDWRYDNAAYSKIMNEWATLAPDDPKFDSEFLAAYAIYLKDLPVIPVSQAIKMIAFDTKYWTNWPSVTNNYIEPPTWWQSMQKILHNLKPAGSSTSAATMSVTMAATQ